MKIEAKDNATNQVTITLDGDTGDISAGANGKDGDLILKTSSNTERIRLDADSGGITCRSAAQVAVFIVNGNTGEVTLQGINAPGHGLPRISFEPGGANIWVGGNGQDGELMLFHKNETANKDVSKAAIHLNGNTGDIILKNADCAEEFDMEGTEAIEPGTVVVLAQEGRLQESKEAYDRKVAGVVSGAGEYRPAILLDKRHSKSNRLPIALVGKVYCKVDAQYSSIEAGDLLTTSPTPGHAMKANDHMKAFGAVLGKALRPLQEGRGMVPILIALQ